MGGSYECLIVGISVAFQFVSIDSVSSYLKDETCNPFDFFIGVIGLIVEFRNNQKIFHLKLLNKIYKYLSGVVSIALESSRPGAQNH